MHTYVYISKTMARCLYLYRFSRGKLSKKKKWTGGGDWPSGASGDAPATAIGSRDAARSSAARARARARALPRPADVFNGAKSRIPRLSLPGHPGGRTLRSEFLALLEHVLLARANATHTHRWRILRGGMARTCLRLGSSLRSCSVIRVARCHAGLREKVTPPRFTTVSSTR